MPPKRLLVDLLLLQLDWKVFESLFGWQLLPNASWVLQRRIGRGKGSPLLIDGGDDEKSRRRRRVGHDKKSVAAHT